MKRPFIALAAFLLAACATTLACAQDSAPAAKAEALQAAIKGHPHLRALLIARGDRQVFEHYRADTTATTLLHVASVSKSLTSLLAGIAADRGLLRIDEPLSAFFPEHAQGANAGKLSRVALRHLLTLSPGFDRGGLNGDTDYNDFVRRMYAPGLLQHAFSRPIASEPGSRFYYSNIDSQLVAEAVARRVNVPLGDFARQELFGPLGITAIDWGTSSDGVLDGAAGVRMRAPDMLRIGQLMLRGGVWDGKQVISKRYVEEATSRQVASDLPPRGRPDLWGYGYLWWTSSTPGDDRPAFYAAGYGGQFIYVVPSLDVVIVAVTEQASREVAARTAALLRDFALPVAR